MFLDKPIELVEDYFSKPMGRADLLKSPEHFPVPECRYTLKELTFVWHMYGGSDFTHENKTKSARTSSSHEVSR